MHDKISIGFVVNNLVVGGVSTVVLNLCNSLEQKKYDIHLIVLSSENQMEEIIPLKKHVKKTVIEYEFSTGFSLLDYLDNSFNLNSTHKRARKVLTLIANLNLSILHFHTLPKQLAIGILAKKENKKLQLVFTDHSVRFTEKDYRFYQRFILSIAYRKLYRQYNLIAVSPTVRQYIEHNSFKNKKLILNTLSNSLKIENYARTKPIDKNGLYNCIYISRIDPFKGHNTLISAWKKLKHPKKGKLFIIGPDETNGDIQLLANKDDSIIFTGSISNIKDYLNESTIGLFPSLKEGLPLSLLEQMAYELPIIVSDIAALTSIITDSVEGLHFKVNDVDDLFNKLQELFDDPERLVKMGLAARRKVELICNENDSVKFHNTFYQKILNQTK